jgi:hypothetical protein
VLGEVMLFVLVLLSAAPKQCGSDKDCMLEAVKTCGPAIATRATLREKVSTRGTVSVSPKSRDVCQVTLDLVATAIDSSASARAEGLNAKPEAHQLCEMEPGDLVEFFEGKPKSLRRPAQCYPASCPAPTAQVESGCSWSSCDGTVIPQLQCGAKSCALRVNNLCTLDGVRASDCSAIDLLAYDCMASCPSSGDVVLECRTRAR